MFLAVGKGDLRHKRYGTTVAVAVQCCHLATRAQSALLFQQACKGYDGHDDGVAMVCHSPCSKFYTLRQTKFRIFPS